MVVVVVVVVVVVLVYIGFSFDGKIGFLSLCTLTMGQLPMVRLDSMIMSSVLMVGVDFHSTCTFLMGLLSDGTVDFCPICTLNGFSV